MKNYSTQTGFCMYNWLHFTENGIKEAAVGIVLDTHSRQFSQNARVQCVSSINVKWGCGIFIWDYKIGKLGGKAPISICVFLVIV